MKPMTLEYAEGKLRRALDDGDLAQIELYGELVDTLDEMHRRPPPTLADAALWYAELGLHVFPLSPRSKVPPKGSHGLDDATTDHLQIAEWWADRPEANIGLATGHLVDVLDVDGEVGERSLSAMLGERPDLLSTSIGSVSTPRPGGRHFYFAASGMRNGTKLDDGIDIRGLGGYVVVPPSMTDVGAYTWARVIDAAALS